MKNALSSLHISILYMFFLPNLIFSQEILYDATALVKPELFSHIEGREDNAYGIVRNIAPGKITVKNTRNGTVSEMTLVESPEDTDLQPNTLYINSRGAESLALDGKSCFVDITYASVLTDSSTDIEEPLEEDLVLDENPISDDGNKGISEEIIIEEPLAPEDNVITDPEYGTDVVLGFDDLEETTPNENLNTDDSDVIPETYPEQIDDIVQPDMAAIDEEPVIIADSLIPEETDTYTDIIPGTEEEPVVADDLLVEENEPEIVVDDVEDIVYFLEPSDFRPPEEVIAEPSKSMDNIVMSPIKDGSAAAMQKKAPETDRTVFIETTAGKGLYVQIGIYSDSEKLKKVSGHVSTMNYPFTALSSANGSLQTKILVGPFKKDEIGVVLYKMRHSGYSDAFIVEMAR